MMSDHLVSRRTALAVLTLPLVSACAVPSKDSPGVRASQPSRQTGATLATPAAPSGVLPEQPAYVPLPGEVEPGCKLAASQAITAALTWGPDERSQDAASRLQRIGAEPAIAAQLRRWTAGAVASSIAVVYPQYGGISSGVANASVMVVARQTRRATLDGDPDIREFIVDVRLARTGTTWRAREARAPGPPTMPTQLDRGGLLTNDRVRLPFPAQVDVANRAIDPRVINLLTALSNKWRVTVQVLKSGHPTNVYGTNRVSNHTLGRAVDIWAIDDIPVIQHQTAPWMALMREAARLGANEVGGPADLDKINGKRPYFTNNVHQDHVHIGYDKLV